MTFTRCAMAINFFLFQEQFFENFEKNGLYRPFRGSLYLPSPQSLQAISKIIIT